MKRWPQRRPQPRQKIHAIQMLPLTFVSQLVIPLIKWYLGLPTGHLLLLIAITWEELVNEFGQFRSASKLHTAALRSVTELQLDAASA